MTMSGQQWFYADASRQQQGPVDSDALAQLWRDGRVDARTLLWREGQAGWLPLAGFSAEFPWLAEVQVAPPPLPNAATATAAKPARSGMGAGAGCAIAVAVGFVGLMVIGILAAIAIPAYHDYTQRALVMQHIAAATPIKLRISEAFARQGECPSDLALESKDVPAGFSEVWTGRFEDGTCGAQFTFDEVARLPGIKGKKMWFWLDETGTQWKCSSDLDNKILPASCRG